MRLICPGCAAQYEVQPSAIPPDGRDVQCSNCGYAWFQRGPLPDGTLPQDRDAEVMARTVRAVAEPTADEADKPEARRDSIAAEESVHAISTASGADGAAGTRAGTDAETDVATPPDLRPAPPSAASGMAPEPAPPEGGPTADPPPATAPRKIDEAVLSVLREEAEREARARRAEAAALESQPDLGLGIALQPQAAPRRPPDRTAVISEPVQGQEVVPRRGTRHEGTRDRNAAVARRTRAPVADDDDTIGRSKRLPDIEEINSTLRGAADRRGPDAFPTDAVIEARNTRRGFRAGFFVVLGLGALVLAVYVLAQPIAAAVPALAGPLDSYSAAVDGMRLALARQIEAGMRGLLAWMS